MITIDVRTPAEFAEKHYDGAINYPVELLQQGVLPMQWQDEQLRIYCRSGMRAGVATQILQQAGFKQVTNAGGLQEMGL